MPASHERIPNRGLSGAELRRIMIRDFTKMLDGDGMLSDSISFARCSYEAKIVLHMDNPIYPEHVNQVASKGASIQEMEKDSNLSALSTPKDHELVEGESIIVGLETQRIIQSPNMARVENELPLITQKHNMETGVVENVEVKYTGDVPEPATVGNVVETKNVSAQAYEELKEKKRNRR